MEAVQITSHYASLLLMTLHSSALRRVIVCLKGSHFLCDTPGTHQLPAAARGSGGGSSAGGHTDPRITTDVQRRAWLSVSSSESREPVSHPAAELARGRRYCTGPGPQGTRKSRCVIINPSVSRPCLRACVVRQIR